MSNVQTPAGWYPDPEGSGQQRYYDGTTWTTNFAPMGPPSATAPAKKGRGCLYAILGVVGAVILLIVIAAVAIGGAAKKASDDLTKTNAQVVKEVKITSCAGDALGEVEVNGTAHNTSSGRSDYFIEIVVESKSGTQLDSSATVATNVEAGQTAVWKGITTAKFAPGVTCKIASATRHASLNP